MSLPPTESASCGVINSYIVMNTVRLESMGLLRLKNKKFGLRLAHLLVYFYIAKIFQPEMKPPAKMFAFREIRFYGKEEKTKTTEEKIAKNQTKTSPGTTAE